MLSEERQDAIRVELALKGKVLAAELAVRFEVSEDTVRRDLRELAKAGHCRRVYGGALSLAPNLGTINQRMAASSEIKERLAVAVSELILPGQTIFIDAGSTNLAVAKALARDRDLTVITNAPAIGLALADHSRCKTILVGGTLNADKGACLGGQTIKEVRRLYVDVLVLGTCGVGVETGITAFDAEEAELKECLIEQSSQIIVPATADKIGTVAPFHVGPASAIDILLTSDFGRAEQLADFEAIGVRVLAI